MKANQHTWRKGEEHPKAKLTEAQVKHARFLYRTTAMTWKQIAEQLGHNAATLWRAGTGLTWKHIPRRCGT